MEDQSNDNIEEVPRPLNLLPAGLSLICPGLGQVIQGRPIFLWHIIIWVLIIVASSSFSLVVWGCWATVHFNAFVAYGGLSSGDLIFIFFLIFLSVSPLFLVPFVLFTVLDAATWERGKPSPFKKHFRVLFILLLPLCFFSILAPALNSAREAARRMTCCSHLKGLSLAFHNYHDVHGSFPPAYTVDENGKPLHSWRVLILPYIEQKELYDKIRLDEPWDSEYNRQFHDVQISLYRCPSSSRHVLMPLKNSNTLRADNCYYSVVVGDDTLFSGGTPVRYSDITNGTVNTILLVERLVPVCWMDPNNEIRFENACQGINKTLFGIGSEHPSGMNVSFADGSIRFLSESEDGRIIMREKTYENLQSLLIKSAEDNEQSP